MKRTIRSIALCLALFAILPVQTRAVELLIPVGKIIGLQLRNDTVTVAAYDETLGVFAREGGLKIGDEIIAAGGQSVTCAEDVRRALEVSPDSLSLTVRREGKDVELHLSPRQTAEGPRLGVYLRQGIAGIGTVTFYDPDTGRFGTLGHGVSGGGGRLLQMTRGEAFEARLLSVKRGQPGDPGQLRGTAGEADAFAPLLKNTPQGVFGVTQTGWKGEPLPTADYEDIQTGAAVIRSTVTEGDPQEYSVEILKIYPEDRPDGRNFLLKVTDPGLLDITGGIVQGMSGSPIIQNGKLIGAVTHVLVNDPTMGYGIYIGNMLNAAA